MNFHSEFNPLLYVLHIAMFPVCLAFITADNGSHPHLPHRYRMALIKISSKCSFGKKETEFDDVVCYHKALHSARSGSINDSPVNVCFSVMFLYNIDITYSLCANVSTCVLYI